MAAHREGINGSLFVSKLLRQVLIHLRAGLEGLGPWNGRVLVDANNAVEVSSLRAVELGGRASSEMVAQMDRQRSDHTAGLCSH